MPNPMYFHPFLDPRHYIGWGPRGLNSLPASVSLHGVSQHLAKNHYKYYRKMRAIAFGPDPVAAAAERQTFAPYVGNADRIYVMGHCGPGSTNLSTETGTGETCNTATLAQMLAAYGLTQASLAHIRIHACNSATPSAAGAGDSFIDVFRLNMNALGFNTVTIRGYDCATGIYLGWRWGGSEPGWSANAHAVDV